MKKIVLSLGLLIGLSSFAMSQSTENSTKDNKSTVKECCMHGKHQRDRKHDRIFGDLTDSQKEQIKTINENFKKEKDAVMKTRITAEMQQEKIKGLSEQKNKDIYNLLNDEQKKKWNEKKERSTRRFSERKNMQMRESCSMVDVPYCQMASDIAPVKGRKETRRGDRNFMKNRHWGNRPQMLGGSKGIWMLAGIELDDKQKEEYKKIAESHQKEMGELDKKQRSERDKISGKQKEALKKILTDDQKKTFEENLSKIEGERSETKK